MSKKIVPKKAAAPKTEPAAATPEPASKFKKCVAAEMGHKACFCGRDGCNPSERAE